MSKVVEVATKGFIVREGKSLVIKQKIDNHIYTDLPGGKMEYGLTPEENLRKEIKEEIGLEIDNSKFIGTSHFLEALMETKWSVYCLFASQNLKR